MPMLDTRTLGRSGGSALQRKEVIREIVQVVSIARLQKILKIK